MGLTYPQYLVLNLLWAEDGQLVVRLSKMGDGYPSFTSAGCARIYILNDLYVEAEQRGRRVGQGLLNAACDYGRREGAVRLTLSTAVDNHLAQGVYEGAGWKRSDAFITYNYAL